MSFFDLRNIFKKKSQDTLIFQISEDFIEVAAVRKIDKDSMEDHDHKKDEITCHTELLYIQKVPRVAPQKGIEKKSFDDLANNLTAVAEAAIVSRELEKAEFVFGEANIFCFLIDPLSIE